MMKAFTLCLLMAAASYCYAQSGPTFTCPTPPDVYLDMDGNIVVPDLIAGLNANNQGSLTFSQNPEAGTSKKIYYYSTTEKDVTITAKDELGNESSCLVRLKVIDNIPPKFIGGSDPGVWGDFSTFSCQVVLSLNNALSLHWRDNSGSVEIDYSLTPTTIALRPRQTEYTFTFTVKDQSGNKASKSYNVGLRNLEDIYPSNYEVNAIWPADKTVNWHESEDPTSTGFATANAPNKPCQPEVSYGDIVSQGTDYTKPDFYNYTIRRVWEVQPYFKEMFTHEQIITVQDVTPPTISNIIASPSTIPVANNAMYDVSLEYYANDETISRTFSSVSVTSNESTKGKGSTVGDWEIVNAGLVRLRAESGTGGENRVYTITVTSMDISGNKSTKSTTVTVGKPKGRKSEMAGSTLGANLQIIEAGSLQLASAPNPTTTSFNIRIAGTISKEKVMLKVTNAVGQVIEVRAVAAGQTITLGSSYQSGVYFIEAIQGKEKASLKLVKTK